MKKILGLLIVVSTTLFSRELTLQQAIDLGLDNSKSIKISGLSQKNSKLNVKKAFKAALPVLRYSGKYQKAEHSKTPMIDTQDAKSGYLQTIGIYQPLFRGGAITGGILGAEASKNIANINLLSEKRDVRLNVISLYSDIINDEKDITVLNASMKQLQARYEKQKEQLKLRLITKSDLLKTEYSILDLDSQITGIKTKLEIARKDFKLKLMIPLNEKIVLKEFDIPNNLSKGIDFESDLTQALTNSLSARLALNKLKYAKAEKVVSRAGLLPQIDAFATYGTARESHHFNNSFDNAEWRGGVSIKWDVFSFGSDLDSYDIAKNNETIQTVSKEQTTDNIRLSVTKNYRELIRLGELKKSRKKALETAVENLKIDTERYNNGLISTVDYLLSESQQRKAAVDYNAARLDYYVAFEKYRSSLI